MLLFVGRLYAVQRGMELDKKSPEGRTFLASLMDVMEQVNGDNLRRTDEK